MVKNNKSNFSMKILIIDRDDISSEMMRTKLSEMGHECIVESVKNDGVERVSQDKFDLVFVNPSPMKDSQALALNLRRNSRTPLYLTLLASEGEEVEYNEVMAAGCNDFFQKPIDPSALDMKIASVMRLQYYSNKLADMREDFPSAGGIIAKSAFNQLFLSALDRGGRYKERTYILIISIDNYEEIKDLDGNYNAEYSASKMANIVANIRRMSDIIGQIGINEYSLLLQRTKDENEAVDAAKRFSSVLDEAADIVPSGGHKVHMSVSLLHLPSGREPFKYSIEKMSDL